MRRALLLALLALAALAALGFGLRTQGSFVYRNHARVRDARSAAVVIRNLKGGP